jgi:small-conductance mechanosensitive channel
MTALIAFFARRLSRLGAVISLSLVGATGAIGQTSPTTPATVAAPATAQPLALPEILARADEDQALLDQVSRLLAGPDPVGALSPTLDAITRSVDGQAHLAFAGDLRGVPVMRLESLARQWAFNERRFSRWEASEQRAFSPYADQAVRLAQRRAVWAATRAQGILDGLPPVLTQRVDAILQQIEASEAALSAALSRQDALKQRAGMLKARLQAGADATADAIDHLDRQLLRLDVPPLWSGPGLASHVDSKAAFDAADKGLAIESQFALDYRATGGSNQDALKLVHVLLIPLIAWLAFKSRRARTASAPGGVARALRRPVSTWLLLSMLAVLVLEPDAPLLVEEFVLLIALIPALRLLPGGIIRQLGKWPYVAVALYVVDRMGVAVVGDASLYRLFGLGLSCMALALTLWLLRRASAATAPPESGLAHFVRPVASVVAVLLAIAVVANVVGNVTLAETLTSGIIDTGYMALVLYAAAAAIIGIASALVDRPAVAGRRFIVRHGASLRRVGTRALMLAALAGWLFYGMTRFRVLRPIYRAAAAIWELGIDVGEVSIHIGDVVVFVFATWLAFWAARGLRMLLREELPRYASLPRGAGNSIASLSYYAILILGFLLALSAAGFKLSQLALIFGALGVGIGFGLQTVVNNFVSGLVLMVERPIQPGDVVDVAGSSGTVRAIGLRATVIRTFEGADVVVPNGLLLSGNLTNWTMFDRTRRIEVIVGVAYGADPGKVIDVLLAAARETPGISDEPKPSAQLIGYGDSALQFALRAWTHDLGALGDVRSDLLARALAAVDAAGFEIPFPQLEVHLRKPFARD